MTYGINTLCRIACGKLYITILIIFGILWCYGKFIINHKEYNKFHF